MKRFTKYDSRFTKKMGRRRFLIMSIRAVLGIVLTGIIPVKISGGANGDKKKFVMKIKPFNRSDLYQAHKLAG